jgi:hypothetical protein
MSNCLCGFACMMRWFVTSVAVYCIWLHPIWLSGGFYENKINSTVGNHQGECPVDDFDEKGLNLMV